MSTLPPSMPPAAPAMARKTSPLVWILVGLGAFCLLTFVVVVTAGYFFMRNPGLATIKMLAAVNPDIEVMSYDRELGKVAVRDRKTGKTYSVNFDEAKRGRFVLQEDGKSPVSIITSNDGDHGGVEIRSSDSTVKIGGGQPAKVPAWIPEYPNSTPVGAFSAQSADGTSGSYQFSTKDPVDKIAKFYEDGLKSQGLRTSSTMTGEGNTGGAMISAEQGNKSAVVLVGEENGASTVSVTFKSKK